jgi:hypothetical protein
VFEQPAEVHHLVAELKSSSRQAQSPKQGLVNPKKTYSHVDVTQGGTAYLSTVNRSTDQAILSSSPALLVVAEDSLG